MKPSFTEKEIKYLSPKPITYSKSQAKSTFVRNMIVLTILMLIALFLHLFIEPNMENIGQWLATPQAHADTIPMTDDEMESMYCKEIASGNASVINMSATSTSITSFCAHYNK